MSLYVDEYSFYILKPKHIIHSPSTHQSLPTRLITSISLRQHQLPPDLKSQQTATAMYATAIIFAGMAVLAAASPINIAKPGPTDTHPPFPHGSGSPSEGFQGPPPGVPMPTAVPVPRPIGHATCPINGKLVCNGPDQWGLCNWGQVQFQRVAAGTQCLDGEIVFAPGFGTNA